MKQTLSPRELEQLSAHLDGQLPAAQQAALEARLAAEPGLRAIFEGLQRTRSLLRRAPQRKLRRAFMLNAGMAGERGRSGLRSWSSLNFASAAAALALVLVLAADFSVNGLPTPPASALRAGEAQSMMATAPESFATEASGDDMTLQGGMPEADSMPPQVLTDEVPQPSALKADDSLAAAVARNAPVLEALLASLTAITGLAALHRRKR